MNVRCAELLLAAVIAARSISYLFEKIGLESMEPFTLLGIRFLLAFLLLGILFWRKAEEINWNVLWKSALLGAILFCVMTCELLGLQSVTSSLASFLENTAVVFVPLLEAVICHRWPRRKDLVLSAVILLGVGLLVFQPERMSEGAILSIGIVYCLLAAVLYAVWILATSFIVRKESPFIIGILGLGFVSLFSITAAVFFEHAALPATMQDWGVLLVLAFVCSAFGFTLQPVAQRYVSAERAVMFCALNPVVAAVLGCVFLQEQMDIYGIVGAVLIIMSLLVSQQKSGQISVE